MRAEQLATRCDRRVLRSDAKAVHALKVRHAASNASRLGSRSRVRRKHRPIRWTIRYLACMGISTTFDGRTDRMRPGSSRLNAVDHRLQHIARDFRQHLGCFRGLKVATFMAEEGATRSSFKGMQCPVNADDADAELLSGTRQIPRLHECKKDFELAKRDLFVDSRNHGWCLLFS